jgi:serine protease SohB
MTATMPDDVRRLMDRCRDAVRPWLPQSWRGGPVVPVVRLQGTIGFSTPLRPGLTLAGVAKPLDRAFNIRHAVAVALVINSPGGSPAQSHLIYRRVRQLAAEKGLPVLAFVEDVAASGGYMLACAADEIICDAASIVGSIGVVSATFGLVDAIGKLGIERRVYTAGKNKVMLDPFQEEKPEDVERLRTIQRDIHSQFIALVKERRGPRLAGADDDLFSGEFWTAPMALSRGLIDELGDLRTTLRQRFGTEVLTPLMQPPRTWLGRPSPGVEWGVSGLLDRGSLAAEVLSAIEARAIWSRFGL